MYRPLALSDLSSEGFRLLLVINRVPTYASINSILVTDNEGIFHSGRYIVILLHPRIGTTQFFLEWNSDTGEVIARDVSVGIENEVLEKIKRAVQHRLIEP